MSGRRFLAAKAKYGFNGQLKDNEVYGEGNSQDYGMRIYDTRLGRFLSVDLIASKYPELTPYQFASNIPICGVDREGEEFKNATAYGTFMKYGPGSLKIEKISAGYGNVQSQLYTLKAMGNAQDFAKLKETFLHTPEKFTNNPLATYQPVNQLYGSKGPEQLKKDDEIMIKTHGTPGALLAPIFVRVIDVKSDDPNSFSMTFATLEGHTDAGTITFSGIINKNGTIEVNIYNVTRENVELGFGLGASRGIQQEQWKSVINNILNSIGKDKKIDATAHTEEFKYDATKTEGCGDQCGQGTTEEIE